MGMPQPSDETLIRYVEADLPPHEMELVESVLSVDPEARRKVAMLRRTAYVLQETLGRLMNSIQASTDDPEPPLPFDESLRLYASRAIAFDMAPDVKRAELPASAVKLQAPPIRANTVINLEQHEQALREVRRSAIRDQWVVWVASLIIGILIGASASYLFLTVL